MEDTLQKVFSAIIAVIIFFLLPLYMAFEKKDDISYSLALKITSSFVDEVRSKGYMTIDMYNNFVSDLAVTDNDYDISIEHISYKYEPVIYAYKDGVQYTFDYNLYKMLVSNNKITIDGITYTDVKLSYKVNEIRYTTDQILNVMDQDAVTSENAILNKIEYSYDESNNVFKYDSTNKSYLDKYITLDKSEISSVSGLYRTPSGKTIYPMNKGDKFTVVIKNTNISIASILFNTLTFGANSGANTKVYINYGGTIQNEEYRHTIIDTDLVEEEVSQYEESLDEEGRKNIYKDGQSYYLSGGLKNVGYYLVRNDNYHEAEVSMNSDHISITNKENGYRTYVATSNKIDLTNYSKLCVDIEGDSNNSSNSSTWISVSSLGNYQNVEVNDTSKQTLYASNKVYGLNKRVTLEVDISEVDTSAYIVISFAHTNSLKIYSIWLE